MKGLFIPLAVFSCCLISCEKVSFLPHRVGVGFTEINLSEGQVDSKGVEECSRAIVELLKEASEKAPGIRILFPAGKFRLNESVHCIFPHPCHIVIKGSGIGVTEFLIDNTVGAFDFTFQDENSSLVLEDFTAYARAASVRTGVQATFAEHEKQILRNFKAFNVELRLDPDDSNSSKCYKTGLALNNAFRPRFDNVIVAGPFGPKVGKGPDSQVYKGDSGIYMNGVYAPEFIDCYMWSCKTGYKLEHLQNYGEEPVHFVRSYAVETLSGIILDHNNSSPIIIEQSHYNCKEGGLCLAHCNNVEISNCLLYNVDDPERNLWPDYRDISLKRCRNVRIHDCIFHFNGNKKRVGVNVLDRSDRISVFRNKFTFTGTSVCVSRDSRHVDIYQNDFDSSARKPVKL